MLELLEQIKQQFENAYPKDSQSIQEWELYRKVNEKIEELKASNIIAKRYGKEIFRVKGEMQCGDVFLGSTVEFYDNSDGTFEDKPFVRGRNIEVF